MPVDVRAALPADLAAIAAIWHAGWHDGHDGHVPEALAAARTEASFRERAAARLPDTSVAVVDGEVAGFVVVAEDEVEQVYVAAHHRGTDVAPAVLAEGARLAHDRGHDRAWLAVATANARARRFYEREGWTDEGPFDYPAEGPDGPIVVACHRYVLTATD
ncbi:GNAT family N-acetyltransferase [Nocardioides sp. SYSU D00038]|uniref:GNAT family N-acetyltransferase n=1 Tax=Nocardioides sp. SYSU D00038 TaxID=2812554 RepID=UPI001967FD86|nr:GNAT family N-acetyltransferase [Nocardioides sp. SYSU D00038]